MIKKGICLMVVLILLTTAFVFAGCKEEEDTGLYVGFECSGSANDESPSDYCAYKSDVSEFDIENVSLDFYYGGLFNISIENELNNGRNIPYVELYFENKEMGEEPYLIKRTTDSYVSEIYRCTMIKDEEGYIIGIDFNHHEQIAVPKELFIGSSGKINFFVFGNDVREVDINEKILSSIAIFYRVDNDKVVLSGKEIKE